MRTVKLCRFEFEGPDGPHHGPSRAFVVFSFSIDIIMTLFTSLLPVSVGQTEFPMKPPAWHRPQQSDFPHDTHVDSLCESTWYLLDGPPYANGALHLGHVRNKLLKDTMVRSAQADGLSVSWRAGWDCHGLPVERNVESLGYERADAPLFLRAARDYAMGQTLAQKEQFSLLHLSCDMEHAYRTMDYRQQADTLRVFAKMVGQGSVYQAYRPVAWCHACESTVANAEVETASLTTTDLYFFVLLSDGRYAMVWTTQAWSLHGHDALLVHPEAEYGLYELTMPSHGDARAVWLSRDAVEEVEALGVYAVAYMGPTCKGTDLVGLTYTLPWTPRAHTVYAHRDVAPAAGTGWLHASAACSEDDFAMLRDSRAPMESLKHHPMRSDGTMTEAPHDAYWLAHGRVGGEALERDTWCHTVRVKREKDHCWRHKVPLTVRPSAQWYVRLDEAVRERARERVERVMFVPESGRTRLLDAVAGRPDWCVSRQRTWGVPLCLYADAQGNLAPFAVEAMLECANLMDTQGSAAALDLPRERDGYTLCTDVLDVWFDSGACFLTTMEETPDAVVEGHDQFRGWFQSSLLVSSVLNERLPYRKVVAHGFVLARPGEKLSKSTGNANKPLKNAPPEWMEVHPDVLRVWANHGEVGNDKYWNMESFQNATVLYQKWRNTLRFVLANLPAEAPPVGVETQWWDAERWTVSRARSMRRTLVELLRHAQTGQAVDAMQSWCQELSNHAFMMVKDRLYCGNAQERDAVHAMLREVVLELGEVMQVMLPCTWTEAQAYLPGWFKHADTCNKEESTGREETWTSWLTLREWVALRWSEHSVKGKGGLMWAHVHVDTLPSYVSHAEALQWLGVSALTVGGQGGPRVEVMLEGVQCERCRMVGLGDCVFCSERSLQRTRMA